LSADNEDLPHGRRHLAAKVRDKEAFRRESPKPFCADGELEAHIHAFCTPTPDVARAAAAAVDARCGRQKPPAWLAGVPMRNQSDLATKDILTVMGSPLYRDFVADEKTS